MTFSRAHEKVLRKFIYCEVEFVLVGGHAAIFVTYSQIKTSNAIQKKTL
jgi:hypothetical protein